MAYFSGCQSGVPPLCFRDDDELHRGSTEQETIERIEHAMVARAGLGSPTAIHQQLSRLRSIARILSLTSELLVLFLKHVAHVSWNRMRSLMWIRSVDDRSSFSLSSGKEGKGTGTARTFPATRGHGCAAFLFSWIFKSELGSDAERQWLEKKEEKSFRHM